MGKVKLTIRKNSKESEDLSEEREEIIPREKKNKKRKKLINLKPKNSESGVTKETEKSKMYYFHYLIVL